MASGSKDTDIIIWDLVSEVGLVKLRGHKDQITGLHFLNLGQISPEQNGEYSLGDPGSDDTYRRSVSPDIYLLSTGKDALLKLWDLAGYHCIETHVAQSNGQCWALAVSPDGSGLITAGNEGELKMWALEVAGLYRFARSATQNNKSQYLRERGALYRRVKDRTTGVSFHPGGSFIAAHGSEKLVEIWRIRSEGEIQKKLARKRKRRREKMGNSIGDTANQDADNKNEDISSADIDDLLTSYADLRTGGRVRSISWANLKSKKMIQILTSQTNNQLELYNIPTRHGNKVGEADEPVEPDRTCAIDLPGHRTDVRALAVSSDDRMLASASQGTLKIWNLRTTSCIRTLECGYVLCTLILPGDKIVIVGNRQGELEIFDISSSTLIDTVKCHEDKIWALHIHPDGRSIVTGSEDKTAKFFKFEVVQEEIPGTQRTRSKFRVVHTRTLKVNDAILSLRYSPDARLLAVALLDNTVKIFFSDSLTLFLNLYGHKLPVLSLDISYDSKMIVTCSADKNVRLWGLDFGDCHKALFAHQDSITQVAFVPKNVDGNGHHFFSASKDRLIKYWDGDKFEQIQKLEGHHGEIWAMALSRSGEFIVTAGHDKSIRVWHQTGEQIFLEEEREKELEELYESTLTTTLDQGNETGDEAPEATGAGKQTIETLMAGEKIAEALELGLEDHEMMEEYEQAKSTQAYVAPPVRNALFLAHNNISAEAHLLNVVQKVKAAALQDSLLVLSFDRVCTFFIFLRIWAERQWSMPLTCRILFFLLKTHHKQIVASKQTRALLDGIRAELRLSLEKQKDELGFNLAALRFVGRQIGENGKSEFVDGDLLEEEDVAKGKKKRGFIDIA